MSKYSLWCVVKTETGLELDFVIMSLYCQLCRWCRHCRQLQRWKQYADDNIRCLQLKSDTSMCERLEGATTVGTIC